MEGVTTIGSYAFYQHTVIAEVALPNTLITILSYAFQGCSQLASVYIPDGVTVIESRAFYSCTQLTEVHIPANVTTIGYRAFYNCYQLSEVYIAARAVSIGTDAFSSYYVKQIFCYEGSDAVTYAESKGISYCAAPTGETLGHVYGDWYRENDPTCTKTGNDRHDCARCDHYETRTVAAYGHDYQAVVTAPTCVEQGYTTHTCSRCGDSYVDTYTERTHHYANGVCSVCGVADGAMAEGQCGSTMFWSFYEDGKLVIYGKGAMYSFGSSSQPWYAYKEQITSVEIMEGITSVGQYAFYNHTALTEVVLPNTLISVLYGVFQYCSQLTSVSIPDNVTSIGSYAFYGCQSLTELHIPANVTTIGIYAFYDCYQLSEVYISANVVSIDTYAFSSSYVKKLFCYEESAAVTYAQNRGISYCAAPTGENLGHVYGDWYRENDPTCTKTGNDRHDCVRCDHYETSTVAAYGHDYQAVVTAPTCVEQGYTTHTCSRCSDYYVDTYTNRIDHKYTDAVCDVCGAADGALAEGQCGENLFWRYYEDGKLVIYGKGEMYNFTSAEQPWMDYKDQIITAELLYGATTIGQYAFYDHNGLRSVITPDTLRSIKERAFEECNNLEYIELNEGLEHLGWAAFWWCQRMTAIDIPDTVTRIEGFCFAGCYVLSSVRLPQQMTQLDSYAFFACYGLEDVYIPENLTFIGDNAFGNCNLSSVRIPQNVTSIQSSAFATSVLIFCYEDSAALEYAQTMGNPYCVAPSDDELGHAHTYVDNGDDTHHVVCDSCGMVLREYVAHEFVDGECACGAEQPGGLLGDLDLDGDVDAYDLTLLARHVGGIALLTDETALSNADVDGDGDVDAYDLTIHARYVGGIITDWET